MRVDIQSSCFFAQLFLQLFSSIHHTSAFSAQAPVIEGLIVVQGCQKVDLVSGIQF
jgi:hypothetical protein